MTEEDYEWNEEEYDVDWTGALWDDWSDDWSWSDWDWTGHWDEWCDQSWTDYGDWSYSEPSAQHLASPPAQTAQTVQAPATASGTVSTVTGFPNAGTTVSSSTAGTLQSVSAVSTPLKPRTGPRTGSFGGAFVSTIAALSVLGTTEGTSVHSLPVHFALDDVTVQNGPCDKLAWMHDYCVASVPTERDWVLFDSGAAAHCCPFDYASDYPLLPLGPNPPNLRSATGKPLKMYGRRLVQYDCNGVKLWVNYYVCDVSFCLVSVARMLLQNYWTVLGKDCLLLLTPDHETVPVLRYGTLLYLSPRLVPYCQEWKDTVYHEFDDYMNSMSVDLSNVHVTANEETDPLKKLETLVSTLKPHYYHTDQWTLDEANLTLTRTHKRTRRSLFTPDASTCPVPLDRLIGRRVTFVDYGQGKTDKLVDNNFKDMENPNRKLDDFWKGRTVFSLRAGSQTKRVYGKQHPGQETQTEKSRQTETTETDETLLTKKQMIERLEQTMRKSNARLGPDGHLVSDTLDSRRLTEEIQTYRDFDDPGYRRKLTEFFLTPSLETGELPTNDYWLVGPAGWIRIHHAPRRTLYFPREEDGGPLPGLLGSRRLTCMVHTDDDDWNGTNYLNHWRAEDQAEGKNECELDMGVTWTGFILFEAPRLYDEIVEPETTDLTAKPARPFPIPNEPTEQQKAIHNLTHLPYQSWCPICTKAKGKEQHSKRQKDRQPVIQVDYCFVKTSEELPNTTILTAVDVQTGLGMSVVAPSKGRDKYCIAELKKFIFEIGRTYGIIQYDPEPSLKALVTDLLKELGGMSMRATPKDWKQAHGSIGNWQQNFYGQIRALRLQLQERYNVIFTSEDCLYPWVVKHAQFTLNRFLTHSDGLTSYCRRWGKDYTSNLCEFGESVLFRFLGKLKEKGDTAWHCGIWLGRDTEADENIVFHENHGVLKARTVRRQVPSKQWNRELLLALGSTPWDPKGKNELDITFVLPPDLGMTGRIRKPPGLELPTSGNDELHDSTKDLQIDELSPTNELELSTLSTGSETRLATEHRARHAKRQQETEERSRHAKRTDETELPEELQQEDKRLTLSFVGVNAVTTVDSDIPVEVNQDEDEKKTELRLLEPQLLREEAEFPSEHLVPAMQKEMKSMKDFDVYEEVPLTECSQEDIDGALESLWVKTWKTAEMVRARLVVQGCYQGEMDQDTVFASTSTLVTLRVLVLMSLSRCWTMLTCDISTAFLHALMTDKVFVIPPREFYPDRNCLWKLKRAMYGLKQAPALWQNHFCSVMLGLGFHRCKADPNLYCHKSGRLYVLCYVDDLLVCGDPDLTKEFTDKLAKEVLLKIEGELKAGTTVNFLGRTLKHNGDSVDIIMSTKYVEDLLDVYNMRNSKPVTTTGTATAHKTANATEPLSSEEHKRYRTAVGKLLWLALVRPDLAYGTKELSRDLTAPTQESVAKLKHLLRYVNGTKDFVQRLRPAMTLSSGDCTLDLDCFVDSDWAGCNRTRKSTSGTVVELLDSVVAFGSRTQGTVALSSGEAELYAIGQGTSETLFVKNLLMEAKLVKKINITIHTDSTAGKSMATRFGASKKTKHVELRFLYMQDLVARGIIKLKKVGTKINCADPLTKNLSGDILNSHLVRLCVATVHFSL